MKKLARLMCVLLAVTLVGGTLSGCHGKVSNEKTALVLSTGELDNIFSPFFSTSAYDSEIHGQTQISMLSTTPKGEVYCGDDEPTMAKNYSQTIYLNGNAISEDELSKALGSMTDEEKKGGENYYTEYKFLIKNGIKDSDGVDLTIKDVIFNMYAYLDPMYSGSNTMYSTDIMGLNDYRTGIKNVSEDELENFNESFNQKAAIRIRSLKDYFNEEDSQRESYRNSLLPEIEDQILSDTQYVRKEFWNELSDDWAAAEAAVQDKNDFNYQKGEAWKYFLTNYGLIVVTYESDGTIKVEDGKLAIDYGETESWKHDKLNMLKTVFYSMVNILPKNQAGTPQTGCNIDFVINEKENNYTLGDSTLNAETLHQYLTDDNALSSLGGNIYNIAKYYATAAKTMDHLSLDEKSDYFKDNASSSVDSIEGISVEKLKSGDVFKGISKDNAITEDQYVLKIKINAVDPKAIWNFGFAVAPMHYYSNPKAQGEESNFPDDGYLEFNFPGIEGYDSTKDVNFGLQTRSRDYMDKVLKAVNGLPVGAGPYKASDAQGADNYDDHTFYSNNVVYFKRNDYFNTTGEGIENAKIKFLHYQVISTTSVVNSLEQKEIHVGEPNAKSEVLQQLNDSSFLKTYSIENNGYGYIGINARYVNDIAVRRAIMTAMDTDLIKSYYGSLCSIITRPMPSNSWAYPQGALDYYPYATVAGSEEERFGEAVNNAEKAMKETDFSYKLGKDNIYRMLNPNTNKWEKLKFTFTIAGAETDHPAYLCFDNAAKVLAEVGIEAKVTTDANALTKLSAGTLAVWAAAWSSTIDPDMFQVYHKDSQATSVNNWGYHYILDEDLGTAEEKDIIDRLSDVIDEARSVLDHTLRAEKYEEALDYVMELAVEYPTYQRNNFTVINTNIIDINTVNNDPTAYSGVLNKIWEVSLVEG